jgi:hypothetical protein
MCTPQGGPSSLRHFTVNVAVSFSDVPFQSSIRVLLVPTEAVKSKAKRVHSFGRQIDFPHVAVNKYRATANTTEYGSPRTGGCGVQDSLTFS